MQTLVKHGNVLGSVLPKLGFKATSESAGRGYRELKYKPLDKQEWLRFRCESA